MRLKLLLQIQFESNRLLPHPKQRHMVKNNMAYHSAEISPDNFPVLAYLQLKLKKPRQIKAVPRRHDVGKLTGKNDQVNDFEVRVSVRSPARPKPRRFRNHVLRLQSGNKQHYSENGRL